MKQDEAKWQREASAPTDAPDGQKRSDSSSLAAELAWRSAAASKPLQV
jgi:hypothetical protein